MKILVISNLYPDKKTPYHGTFVKNFIDELRKYPTATKVDVCLLKGQPRSFIYKLYKYIFFYALIIKKLLFHKYDLIYVHFITHASIPILLVRFFRPLNLVFNIHGEDLLVVGKLANFLLRISKPLLRRAKYIVVPSYFFKEIAIKMLPEIKPHKFIVSPSSGVTPIFYKERFFNNKLEKKMTIGYVSRIERGKGWDTFLNAIKILKDRDVKVKVLLVGGGTQEPLLNKQMQQLELLDIKRLGRQPYTELPEIYDKIDLFVFPTKLVESLGLVGLEAMASSTPIVGSRIGGLQDYIKEGVNGFFFKPGDEEDLANKIESYLKLSISEKQIFMKAAYQTASEYESDMVLKRLFDFLLNKNK